MIRSYTPLPPSAFMACSGTALAFSTKYIKWLGHAQKMDTSRITKRILEWKPMESMGLRWLDDVCDDLKALKVRKWKELAMDRKAWSHLSMKA
jgi:hypothetical protein